MSGGAASYARRLLDWLRAPSTLIAAALVVVGLMFVFLQSQSPSKLYWTGDTTTGTIRGGLVYYRVDGSFYTIDTDLPVARPKPITVYYDPAEPSQGLYDKPATRWVEGATMAVWFVAAAAVLFFASLRQRRQRRRGASEPDWMHTYLSQRPPRQ